MIKKEKLLATHLFLVIVALAGEEIEVFNKRPEQRTIGQNSEFS